jgi:hypothetical protein
MSGLKKFHISDKKIEENRLRIANSKVTGSIAVFKFIDKDTRQMVLYVPCLEVTSYGANEDKAWEMLKFSIDDYFEHLISLPRKKREVELNELGWTQDLFRNKEFSKAYININGELQNFNAVANEIELLTIEA